MTKPPIMGFSDPYEDAPPQTFLTVEDCAQECRCRGWFLVGLGLLLGLPAGVILHRVIA